MKKLITLFSLFIVISSGVKAQYYDIPYIHAGNPGGLNTDYDDGMFYGLGTWTYAFGDTSGTPVWSQVMTIPFNFKFNDTAVTSFKVSTSGVLTFTTAASAVPPVGNPVLPSASVPNNSVCVLGIASLGQAASIGTDTFGVAPHRQFWIGFVDFQSPGQYPANPNNYDFWSIVFEETSNNIYIVDQMTDGFSPTYMSLGIQINNTTAYSVAGSPDVVSLTKGSYYDSTDDNSYYRFIQGTLPANDIELTNANLPIYVLTPSNVNVTGTVTNVGLDPITSFSIKYQSGINIYTDSITGVNITTGQTYNFTHSTPLNVANPTYYPIKVWADLAGDVNHANDTLSANVSGLSFMPVKNVVFEEGTGTWCGFCPGGAVYMDTLTSLYPDRAMLIAIHDYDPMTDVANDTAYDYFMYNSIPGYPAIIVDRQDIEANVFNSILDYQQYVARVVPCNVSVTTSFDPSSRLLTINASSEFATDLTGDFRFNAVVTEDTVRGTGSDWDQHNYYSSTSSNNQNYDLVGAGHNWQTESDPVPAAKMFYNHVERAILGGIYSLEGSIPSSVTANGTYTHTFTYTVPADYNVNLLKVIAWVCNGTTGEIYNAGRANSVVGIKEQSEIANQLLIYPNPSSGMINIRSAINGALVMKLNVMNSLGETVMLFDKLNIYTENHVLDLSSYSNGLYFLQFTDENNTTYVSKVLINR